MIALIVKDKKIIIRKKRVPGGELKSMSKFSIINLQFRTPK